MAETFVVRLAPHRVGFYDPLNHVHLSKGLREVAELSATIDLRYVRAAVQSGGLILLTGVLPSAEPLVTVISEPETVKQADPIIDELLTDAPVAVSNKATVAMPKVIKKRG